MRSSRSGEKVLEVSTSSRRRRGRGRDRDRDRKSAGSPVVGNSSPTPSAFLDALLAGPGSSTAASSAFGPLMRDIHTLFEVCAGTYVLSSGPSAGGIVETQVLDGGDAGSSEGPDGASSPSRKKKKSESISYRDLLLILRALGLVYDEKRVEAVLLEVQEATSSTSVRTVFSSLKKSPKYSGKASSAIVSIGSAIAIKGVSPVSSGRGKRAAAEVVDEDDVRQWRISRNMYLRVVNHFVGEKVKAMLVARDDEFKIFTTSGVIDVPHLRHVTSLVGERLTEDELDAFLAELKDSIHDGKISSAIVYRFLKCQ